MENRGRKKRRLQRTKSNREWCSSSLDANTIFALMLAAICNSNEPYSESVIKRCLNSLHLSLIPNSQNAAFAYLLIFFLDFPCRCDEIVSRSTEIAGAASIFSFEMNEQIALDGEIVKGLILAVGASNKMVSVAACNAVLDLSTTSIGRERLLEFSALEHLMFKYLQVPESSKRLVSICSLDKGGNICLRIGVKEDDLVVLLLNAAITLINTYDIDQLENMPRKLSEAFSVYLKELWVKVHNQMLLRNTVKFGQDEHFNLSSIRTNNLAESIFRLSINAGHLTTPFPFEVVKKSIFGTRESSFENFILNHWEVSPLLVRSLSKGLNEQDDVFSSFIQYLNLKKTVSSFVLPLLQGLVSCLPIDSDELNILNFLKTVRNELGCLIIYGQDIRVLRTMGHLKEEAPHFLYIDDILKCEDAYNKGYTIALRGMEFRFESIAAIADGLASLFGQPSVGVNLYLTPPDSQGLARHYDDHCVFVCQLFGTKQWTIVSQPIVSLPRLYEPLDSLHSSKIGNSMAGRTQFLLREGDILYIPRGFPHEACTVAESGGPDETTGFSLHLTLAIEVEPPFEWEGFAHVALHCWNQSSKSIHYTSVDPLSEILSVMSVNLLHIAIRLIGDSDPTFRKACLVAAITLPSDSKCWLGLNQRTIFIYIIDKICSESGFLEALRVVEVAIQKNEDPFQRLRWLQLLNWEAEMIEEHGGDFPSVGFEKLSSLFNQHRDKAEVAFMNVKSKFCCEVAFEDVIDSYGMVLEKYKKTRKQYMNGMLSLHCK
ncbi:unnamed protein product, partial [Vitis vinifera]